LLDKGDGEQGVESWNPNSPKQNTELVEMTHIDQMERQWMEEYDYIVQKDKDQNKDFNRLAL